MAFTAKSEQQCVLAALAEAGMKLQGRPISMARSVVSQTSSPTDSLVSSMVGSDASSEMVMELHGPCDGELELGAEELATPFVGRGLRGVLALRDVPAKHSISFLESMIM